MSATIIKICLAIVCTTVLVAYQEFPGFDLSPGNGSGRSSTQALKKMSTGSHSKPEFVNTDWSIDAVGRKSSGDYESTGLSISADGRFVAFQSSADNLVFNDSNKLTDIFVLDLHDGSIRLVSKGQNDRPSDGVSSQPKISSNGQYVAFRSVAKNLVANDKNRTADIFVHELSTGITRLASVTSAGLQIDIESRNPSISADGQRVAFETRGSKVVPGDSNAAVDIFVRDISQSHTYAITSTQSVGEASVDRVNQDSVEAQLSDDGKRVVFQSFSPFLIEGDNNGYADIFEAEVDTGLIRRVSEASGIGGSADSFSPSISQNGRFISYSSAADNIVTSLTNGELQIFVYDRDSGHTIIVSKGIQGAVGNGPSLRSKVANNGDTVFVSYSTNLVDSAWDNSSRIFVSQIRGETRTVSSLQNRMETIVVDNGSHSFDTGLSAQTAVFIGSKPMSSVGPAIFRASRMSDS